MKVTLICFIGLYKGWYSLTVNSIPHLLHIWVGLNVLGEVTGTFTLWTLRSEVVCWSVESPLMVFLQFGVGVTEDLLSRGRLLSLFALGHWETIVQHHLVVFDQTHFSLELIIVAVLGLQQDVLFLSHCGCMTVSSPAKSIVSFIILSQVAVERSLAVGWLIGCS